MGGRQDGSGTARREARGWPVGLLAAALVLPLAGCGWLFGSDTPSSVGKARPGVDRKAPVTGTLPPASGQHDAAIVATDPVGPAQVGAVVPAKGGQKAQKETADKEAAERDSKEREERQRREANEREAREAEKKDQSAPRATPESSGVPAMPQAAKRGNEGPAPPLKAQPESVPGAGPGAVPSVPPIAAPSAPVPPADADPVPPRS